jgi:membrane protease YdiL (CAAX protease family)
MPWDFWLIFVILGVILPWRGRSRVKKLLEMQNVGRMERLSLYASTIAFQWFMVSLVGWRVWAHRFTASELGLAIPGGIRVVAAAMIGAGAFVALQGFNLRRMGRTSTPSSKFLRSLGQKIFPQTNSELLAYIALALTAGICEEFLYRGFAMAAFLRAGLPVWGCVLLSASLFGLAHLYQGRGGLAGTLLLGILFGAARIGYDSLLPVMAWHAAVDLVAGVAGPRYLSAAPSPNTIVQQ